eukprot:gene17208-29869_t
MLKPDMPYDQGAVMTGSVTIVNGTPTALYSSGGNCGSAGPATHGTCFNTAQPADLSDPLL